MGIELIVTFEDGRGYITRFSGDKDIIQSALKIYCAQLIVRSTAFEVSFSPGDDQT
jgi:hypothetical protein